MVPAGLKGLPNRTFTVWKRSSVQKTSDISQCSNQESLGMRTKIRVGLRANRRSYGSLDHAKKTCGRKHKMESIVIQMPLELQSNVCNKLKKSKRTFPGLCCDSSQLFGCYFAFYMCFLATGALVFSVLEAPEEQALVMNLEMTRRRFLNQHPNVKGIYFFI